jgi:hypothetical protein
MVRGGIDTAAQTIARFDVADPDGVRVHRTAGHPQLPQAERHTPGGRGYGSHFHHTSKPSWKTYASLLVFAAVVRSDLEVPHPRDMIDIRSFL